MRLRVVTANVNGIRAAVRRGGLAWLSQSDADVIALQEVRADPDQLREVLADGGLGDWWIVDDPGNVKGRAGVAIVSKHQPASVDVMLSDEFAESGRFIEARYDTAAGPVTVASTYVFTGHEADAERQAEKYRFLDALGGRLQQWTDTDQRAVLVGDLNVGHREDDIKNWKGNRGKAGFLDDERARLDGWLQSSAVDVHRSLYGPGPGPYTWWSWRGRAFDNDAGWRIDYHMATPSLARCATAAEVGRAASYAERWSDHAPVVVDYELDG